MQTEQSSAAKLRITQIFKYLEALDQRRNPAKSSIKDQPWVYWLRDLPTHPSVQRGTMEESGFVLKVKRPPKTHAPSPPKRIDDWVKPGWKELSGKPEVYESLNQPGPNNEVILVQFDEDPLRVERYQDWKAKWEHWYINERPARDALKLFEKFYALYGDIDRDSEKLELMLGDGILNWRLNFGDLHHPLLLTRLQLEFDPKVPEFTFIETERPVEFYSAIFRKHSSIDGQRIGKLREEVDEAGFHPLGSEDTSGFLTRLVRSLSPNGEFIGQGEPQGFEAEPRVGRDPVIFLRTRTLGFATALDAIIQSLQNETLGIDLPSSLVNIVGIETETQAQNSDDGHFTYANEDENILLSKPANPEQLQIARRLEKYGSVLVQGPPGTGKTHTIANLIGHLLAQGKSILVTSHTTKALSVLREQVVQELQPLCVSSLESDSQSRAQLEYSVNSIVQRLASSDQNELNRAIVLLAQQRKELLDRLAKVRHQLLEARTDEYRSVVVNGQGIAPTVAAKNIANGVGHQDWIPSPVTLGSYLPLSIEELTELYASNEVISPEDEQIYACPLPLLDNLIEPFEFDNIVASHKQLADELKNQYNHLWTVTPEKQNSEDLQDLLNQIVKAADTILDLSIWKLDAIEAGRLAGHHRQPWDSLTKLIQDVNTAVISSQDVIFNLHPELATGQSLDDQTKLLTEIVDFLEKGQKLNWLNRLLHKPWMELIPQLKVNQKPPQSLEEFKALHSKAQIEIQKQFLKERWDRQMSSLVGPISSDFGEKPETVFMQYLPLIQDCLNWYSETWNPLEKKIEQYGFQWNTLWETIPPHLKQYGDFYRLKEALELVPEVFDERISYIRKLNIEKAIVALDKQIAAGESIKQNPITLSLKEAIFTRDTESYRLIHARLVKLHNNQPVYQHRNMLINKLEVNAKGWATALRLRNGVHSKVEMPGHPEEAWLWRQWSDELERRASVLMDAIQKEIEELSEELKKVTTQLIDAKAWAAQVGRTSLSQRQALMGWLQIMDKIGAGKGKRVPKLLAEAKNLMQESRSAVPVWIMPLSKVVESFDFNTTKFDVVIIDEASQSDVMGLVSFYLGKQVVIVGDHKQVSPLAVGEKVDEVGYLIEELLKGIPNAVLYDGKMSVYDLARQSFSGHICLKEHFRCVPEIIQFSNWLSYEGEIKPLRDSASVQLKPSIIPYQVAGGFSENKINKQEAQTIVSLIKACIENPAYAGKTFGVISLLGEEQAVWIDELLKSNLEPAQYEKHRIRCGISAQFQGDERHVIFLSMVDGPIEGTHRMRQEELYKKRYNVAVSRAKDQLWVIHSLQPEIHLKAGDLRRQLLEYANDPYSFIKQLESEEVKTESEFERLVLRSLQSRSFKVIPQWKVGYYRIDLVVEGDNKRLAIECDGERYHPPEKLPEDMARQANLERMGWRFLRIRGSEFFRNPEKAMQKVFAKLQELEIHPSTSMNTSQDVMDIQHSPLAQQVLRDAEVIRNKWKAADSGLDIEVEVNTSLEPAPAPAIAKEEHPEPLFSEYYDTEPIIKLDLSSEEPNQAAQQNPILELTLNSRLTSLTNIVPAPAAPSLNLSESKVEDELIGYNPKVLKGDEQDSERDFEDLHRTDFSFLNLENSNFSWSDLKEATFTGSNLKGVKFRSAKLLYADFSNANLENANLKDAKLHMTEFTGAWYNQHTIFPNGFDPKQAGMIDTNCS